MKTALVIGAGPAGLMAAEILADSGFSVTVAETKKSPARKLLMAGKSGLNITKNETDEQFLATFGDMPEALKSAMTAFGPREAMAWAQGLNQVVFTGSTGRVFPRSMKASPLLRTWLARMGGKGVTLELGWKWVGCAGPSFQFETSAGAKEVAADVTILACGGASWARLGSDGAWSEWIDTPLAPFKPANMGFVVDWSSHMERHFGSPVKPVGLIVGGKTHRGEIVVSRTGLEGGGIYTVSTALRDGETLTLDLLPDLTGDQIRKRLARPQGKTSMANFYRKVLGLTPVKMALLQEFARPLPTGNAFISVLKALPVPLNGPRPLDEAISTAGGVKFDGMTEDLMLKNRPGVFCAGEMLDWEAPTGGYLITASLATGKLAAEAAVRWAESGSNLAT
ncbi:TIGR03862 family flavoprotein [Falsihalocynthiibacter sp. S25ZX9]|uniref:TIGR03862 family flavoprotein n=1 Tax=Falsihalocynthiibacter sp. S25ZX9 TaxID=3240870 RepID=UPI00350EFBBF